MGINLKQVMFVAGLMMLSPSAMGQGGSGGSVTVTNPTSCTIPGWQLQSNGVCRPVMPMVPGQSDSQFIRDANGYPICGAGRLPVKIGTGGISVLDVASSFTPRYTDPDPSSLYKYSATVGGYPTYLYNANGGYNSCVCVGMTYPATPIATAWHDLTPTPSTLPKFYAPSIMGVSQTSNDNRHAVVAISKTGFSDPTLGSQFVSGNSVCGCPNFNEQLVQIGSDSNNPSGAYCISRIHSADPNYPVHLETYNANYVNEIMFKDQEPVDSSGNLITQIPLPPYPGGSFSLQVYPRGIWRCPSALPLNTATGTCEQSIVYHAAGPSNPGASPPIPPSEVSPRARGAGSTDTAKKDDAFANTVNKKLAVCLNGFGTTTNINTTSGPKFDCMANDFVKYPDFNELWASTDKPDDGGLPNALLLANSEKKIITGFYQMNGKHCDEFGEFAGQLRPAIVSPKLQIGTNTSANAVTYTGDPIKTPGQGVGGATAEYSHLQTFRNLHVPYTADDMRRCPILVRAAAQYTCPPVGSGGVIATYQTGPDDAPWRRQCTAASDVKIHMRVEQLYEIRGQLKMATVDSIANSAAASSVSIQRIIAEKYGKDCPQGMAHDSVTGECKLQ